MEQREPANGEFYYTLTNNSNRTVNPTGSPQLAPDSAKPRADADMKSTVTHNGNANGHILLLKEGAAGAAATTLTWDVGRCKCLRNHGAV